MPLQLQPFVVMLHLLSLLTRLLVLLTDGASGGVSSTVVVTATATLMLFPGPQSIEIADKPKELTNCKKNAFSCFGQIAKKLSTHAAATTKLHVNCNSGYPKNLHPEG